MPRHAPRPIRRSDLLSLAASARERYRDWPLDAIAEAEGILLFRVPGGKEAGFALTEKARRPVYFESLARPGEQIRALDRWEEFERKIIVINSASPIPEREIFWHEYYHISHSDREIQRGENFRHNYSMASVLHSQEERRADEFAAAILIPTIAGLTNITEITEQHNVSERLARHAITLIRASARSAYEDRGNETVWLDAH